MPGTACISPRRDATLLGAVLGQLQLDRQQRQGDEPDGQVHVEGPAPVEVVGDESADERTGDHRQRHHGGHQALVLTPLAGRDEVADDRHDVDHQAAGAEALDRAEEASPYRRSCCQAWPGLSRASGPVALP
jgi:hypothetical protein